VDHERWARAINFVRQTEARGRKIIILELQTAGYSNAESIPSVHQEIVEAISEGVVVCVPAGNGNHRQNAGLGDDDIVIEDTGSIVVGATRFDAEKNIRAESNGGDRVAVYAPGDSESDLTCGLRGGYRNNFGGTSGATAKVAGVVALMLEKNNRLTPADVRTILNNSMKRAVDDDDNDVGAFLDAEHAVTAAIAALGTAGTLSPARMEREAA
jgi:subtilisin family serine protease